MESDFKKLYVLGFVFYRASVIMVKKTRGPKLNIGRLNGIGGMVEDGEGPLAAMRREFLEETGCAYHDFDHVGRLDGHGYCVHLFSGVLQEMPNLPHENDVGEPMGLHRVAQLLDIRRNDLAQNASAIISHCWSGKGFMTIRE